jgi:hypothetical protein
MKTRTAVIAIALIVPFAAWSNYTLWHKFTESTIVYQTEVVERIVVITSDELDKQLEDECVAIIVRLTGDPAPGVRHLIDRHYQGDACQAAHEAIRGEW